MKDTIFNPNFSLNYKGNLRVYKQPIVMGIINTTPDSFFKGSRKGNDKSLLVAVEKMVAEHAEIIDIGGYSSRPGSDFVSEDEEILRTIDNIKKIHHHFPQTIISIDTFRSKVAELAIQAGAHLINDITGGKADEQIFNIASNYSAPIILMHMVGEASNMMQNTKHPNLTSDLVLYFSEQVNKAKQYGVKDIIIDPGLGFSKTLAQNYSVIKNLNQLKQLNLPILIGASRKSMLYKLLNIQPENALNATTSINTIALLNGANILRVHDVKQAVEAIKIVNQVL